MAHDPMNKLLGIARQYEAEREMRDLSAYVKPLPDGVFPKKVVVRLQSTGEVVAECKIDYKGHNGVFTIPPLMSGNYILEMYPIEPITAEVIDDAPYYPDC